MSDVRIGVLATGLLGETGDPKSLRLVDSRTIGDGLTHVRYEVVRVA